MLTNSQIIEKNIGKHLICLYYKDKYVGLLGKSINKKFVKYTDCTIAIEQLIEETEKAQQVLCINYDKVIVYV